jgi:hypothetical protein
MKTLKLIPTLLAITIQAMVVGQTNSRQLNKIRPDIMRVKENIKLLPDKHNEERLNNITNQSNIENSTLKNIILLNKIEASKLSATIIYSKFDQNRLIISKLLDKTLSTTSTYTKSEVKNSEAEYFMKNAKEMREEADAQFTIPARFANISNAEEKEALALSKQQEIFALFEIYNSSLLKEIQDDIYINPTNTHELTMNSSNELLIQNTYLQFKEIEYDLKQANEMQETAEELKNASINARPNEKLEMIKESLILENDYKTKQITASNLYATFVYNNFSKNRLVIASLLENLISKPELITKAIQLNMEAESYIKLGKEIREEANAQFTKAAILGEISNAEEKETIAINKQQETLKTLEYAKTLICFASN